MKIPTGPSVTFTCPECKQYFIANRTSDFGCIECNSEKQYFVECPICGTRIEVPENRIPEIMRKHIKVQKFSVRIFTD